MRNKTQILLIALISSFAIILTIIYRLRIFSTTALVILAILYLSLAITIYKKFYSYYWRKCYYEAIKFLSYTYVEVIPLYPLLLLAKYHMPFKKDIKVYARFYSGEFIDVKIVSKAISCKISTNNWIWFYANFKGKEP